jgi:DNA-binding NtrC family response regulator
VTTEDLSKLFVQTKSVIEEAVLDIEEIKKLGLNSYLQKIEMDIVSTTLKKNQDKVRKTLTDLKISNNAFYRILGNLKNSSATHV